MVQRLCEYVRVYASGQNLVTFTNTGVIMWILPVVPSHPATTTPRIPLPVALCSA